MTDQDQVTLGPVRVDGPIAEAILPAWETVSREADDENVVSHLDPESKEEALLMLFVYHHRRTIRRQMPEEGAVWAPQIAETIVGK
jgi:hypothetical protein